MFVMYNNTAASMYSTYSSIEASTVELHYAQTCRRIFGLEQHLNSPDDDCSKGNRL